MLRLPILLVVKQLNQNKQFSNSVSLFGRLSSFQKISHSLSHLFYSANPLLLCYLANATKLYYYYPMRGRLDNRCPGDWCSAQLRLVRLDCQTRW